MQWEPRFSFDEPYWRDLGWILAPFVIGVLSVVVGLAAGAFLILSKLGWV